ncbi:hypothetical protein CO611_06635 [Lysobacteraceae bacterium NML03-0222]|nr:hypothetical protein CO611_06635 [Xanthomonadaceae bacterium NML03-0222]
MAVSVRGMTVTLVAVTGVTVKSYRLQWHDLGRYAPMKKARTLDFMGVSGLLGMFWDMGAIKK